MDMSPIDYLSGLGGLQNMPGSYAIGQRVQEDQAQNQQRQASNALMGMQAQAVQAKMLESQQKVQEDRDYQQAASAALADGSPQAISSLITRFPDRHAAVAKGWDIKDAAQKQSDLRSAGEVLSALDAGKHDIAAASMEARIAAEEAAGDDAAQDKQVLAAIKSGDPAAINAARGALRYTLSAVVPDKFTDVLKVTGGDQSVDGSYTLSPGSQRYGRDNKLVAEAPKVAVSKADVFDAGGNKVGTRTVYDGQPVSGGQIEQLALNAVPGATVTSRSRTAEHNAEVGGVPNSYHLTDEARDLVPPQGMKMSAFASVLKQSLPGMKVLDEGSHVHIQPVARNSPGPFMAKPKTASSDGGTGGLSQAAIELAAKQGLARGGLIPTGFSRNKAAVTAIQNRMADLASGKDVSSIIQGGQDLKAQGAAVTDFAKGKLGANVRSLNVAVDHLDQLKMAAAALQNGNVPLFNKISNGYAKQTGSSRPTDFEAVKGFVMDEAVKAIVGAGGGVGDREEAKNLVSSANSPTQLQGAVAQIQGLMGGQLNGLALQYKNSTGRDDFQKRLSPRTIQAIGHHLEGPQSAPVKVTSVQQASALAPGTLYLRPDGKVMRR